MVQLRKYYDLQYWCLDWQSFKKYFVLQYWCFKLSIFGLHSRVVLNCQILKNCPSVVSGSIQPLSKRNCINWQALLIVEGSNRARNLCFWSFYRHYRVGPLINLFLRVYFCSFCRQQRVVAELVIHVCGVLIGIIGEDP